MSLSKNDLRFFQKHYPDVNFDNAYWSFSYWGGSEHAAIVPPSLKSGIWYGMSFEDGGCIAEMSMQWESLERMPGPYLRTFMDATVLLASPMHRKLSVALMKYKEDGPTPEQFAKLLVSLGFEDETTRLPAEQGAPR